MYISGTTLTVPSRLEQAAILYHSEAAHYKEVLGNAVIPAGSRSLWYPEFDAEKNAFKDYANLLKSGDAAPEEIKFNYTKKEITINPYHAKTFVNEDDEMESVAVGLDPVLDGANGLQDVMSVKMNKDLYSILSNTALWTNTAVTAVWSNVSTARCELDIRNARRNIQTATYGIRRPNTMVLNQLAFDYMIQTDKIREIFKYNLSNMEQAINAIKSFFEIERVVILPAVEDTAKKGATPTPTDIWGNIIWIGYIEYKAPAKNKPSAVYGVSLRDRQNNPWGLRVTTKARKGSDMFDDGRKGTIVTVENYVNFKQIAKPMGYLITGVY